MKYLHIIPKALWKTLFLLNFLAGLIILYPFFRILLLNSNWFRTCFKIMRFWARWILLIPFIKVKHYKNSFKNKINGPVVFVANHQSYLDIVVSYYLFDTYFVFIGKSELRKVPLFRVFFERMNILVERKSKIESHKAFEEADKRIKCGESVFLFPEGTINKKAPEIKEFKNGAFKLAIENQVPLVPVSFINHWELLQNGGFFKSNGKPGTAWVKVHQPIITKGLTSDNLISLRDKVYSLIKEPIIEYYDCKRKNS